MDHFDRRKNKMGAGAVNLIFANFRIVHLSSHRTTRNADPRKAKHLSPKSHGWAPETV
jgi:hypothetical protein